MEMSIISETISQQTICGDKEGLNADMETNKEQIYFKYFLSQKMVRTKATVCK